MRARLHRFEAAVLATLRRRRLVRRGGRVLVALSGGRDSVALLAALVALRDAGHVGAVAACHVDHGLRPGSEADGAFCAELCARWAVPLERTRVAVRGANLQASARRARYVALRAARASAGAEWIATAHSLTDQAETVLHRLLRGAGARGLAGILPRRGAIIRPLADVTRAEVTAYLLDRCVPWRDDPTNSSPRFLRNRIRAELSPVLDRLAPEAERRLARAADLLRDDDRALERQARAVVGSPAEARLGVQPLLAVPVAVRRRALLRLWRIATGTRRHLGAAHVEAVLRLLRSRRPARVALPGGVEASVAYGEVELARRAPAGASFAPVVVEAPGTYRVPGRGLAVAVGWDGPQPPPWPVELRTRRPGDRFHPAQAPGGKKLKAWLIDRKVPRRHRDTLLVVADRAGSVLSIPELGAVARGASPLRVELLPDGP